MESALVKISDIKIPLAQASDNKALTAGIYLKEPLKNDSFNLSVNPEAEELAGLFEEIQSRQGLVGKVRDFALNTLKSKNSSTEVEKVLEEYKKGNTTKDCAQIKIANYTKGQKKALDFVSDLGATGAGAIIFKIASSLSCSAPFGLAGAAIAGGFFKCAAKFIDAKTGERKYKTAPYDIVTGGINGLLSPIVNGIGNITSKKTAQKLNIKVVSKKPKFKQNSSVIEKLAFYPKQRVQGTMKEKALVNGDRIILKGLSKVGFAFGLRELTFKALTIGTKSAGKNMLKYSGMFLDKETEEKLKKEIKNCEIDFSNDIYGTENKKCP